MTTIDDERWRELQLLLDRALELSDDQRATWLAELRVRSPDLAAELTSILSGERSADQHGFLLEPPQVSLEGLEVGAYTLERLLGHGGMGSVWLACRTDGRFEGYAAVKLLNLALLDSRGQARFRREGTMLARLTHPGIARLLDAGVAPTRQPYLVIEHVDGERIDAFADARQLSAADRIRLVLQVLEALGHAHANLIVHRDIKPSNIPSRATAR
jgi:serine/threonine protein kinase